MPTRNYACATVALCLSSALAGCASSSLDAPARGDRAGLDAAKQEFFEAWTKPAGETWTHAKLSRVLDRSSGFLSFDAMSSDKTVVRGYEQYLAIWDVGMNGFSTAKLSEKESLSTWIDRNMAVTASIAQIQGSLPDGTQLDFPGHLTLAWHFNDGAWRVLHEHMSLNVKP